MPPVPSRPSKANPVLILQRRGIAVQAVNYAGANLRGRDLSTQDLTGAELSAADCWVDLILRFRFDRVPTLSPGSKPDWPGTG